jgi:hypothetical protein
MRSRLNQSIRIAGLVRDIGVILGVPVLLGIGLHLWDLETKAHEAQIKAADAQVKAAEAQIKSNEAQMKAVEAQNALLNITSYDRTAVLIEGMKKTFLAEREEQDKLIKEQEAQIKAKEEQLIALKRDGTKEALEKVQAEYNKAVAERDKLIGERKQSETANVTASNMMKYLQEGKWTLELCSEVLARPEKSSMDSRVRCGKYIDRPEGTPLPPFNGFIYHK